MRVRRDSNSEITGPSLRGNTDLSSAIGKRLSITDPQEIQQITNALLKTISKHIAQGEQIAFIKQRPDGRFRIRGISIERDED